MCIRDSNYPFSVKSVDLNLTCGFLPYEAGVGVYGVPNSGFAVTNVALKGISLRNHDQEARVIEAQIAAEKEALEADLEFILESAYPSSQLSDAGVRVQSSPDPDGRLVLSLIHIEMCIRDSPSALQGRARRYANPGPGLRAW